MTAPHLLQRTSPESQGVSSSAISEFINGVHQQQNEMHSMMLLRHGSVIAEGWWSPYSADRIHLLYSLSKSFTSTAIGMAVKEGLLQVDDLVQKFFPDKLPNEMSEYFGRMQVHHLLCMGTGHKEDALDRMIGANPKDWSAGFFTIPPDQEPGSIFAYNNAATYMLSAILQKVTGQKVIDYLEPRLFAPLGITQKLWFEDSQGINLGFSGLHLATESIAKLGQLYLQKGEWNGQQLIPQSWVETATAYHIDNRSEDKGESSDWGQGYGYQFWQCRHNAYRGDGAFGQFCVVMPEKDAVFIATSGSDDMQGILDLVWTHLLPAMSGNALPENKSAHETLTEQLNQLAFEAPHGEKISALASTISGQTYDFPANSDDSNLHHIRLDFHDDYFVLVAANDRGEHQLDCGYGEWRLGKTTFNAPGNVPVACGGAWTSSQDLTVEMRLIESPHAIAMHFHFDGDTVEASGQWNVQFGETELPKVRGQLRQ